MSKKQGQKSLKDVLWNQVMQMYRGKKKKREHSGNFFYLFTDSLWTRYLDDNHSFTK